MNPMTLVTKGQHILAQRNFAFVVVVFSLSINLVLAGKIFTQRDRLILIPQNNLQKQIVFDGFEISETYLIDWSSSVLSDLLTVNRYTVDRKNKLFLKISSKSELLKDLVQENSNRIKRDGVSTVFYPKKFTIDRSKKTIFVTGTFMAFFGRDKEPVVQDKTYALGWREAPNGCVLIDRLEEVNKDDI